MAPKDRARFAACLTMAGELYGKEVSDARAEIYFDALKGWEIGAVEHAFSTHFGSPDAGQFFPKPADITKILAGNSDDAALRAWAAVDKAVRSIGPYQSVAFDDAIVHRVLSDMGGWIGLASRGEDEWPFTANEFRTRYRGYKAQGVPPDYPNHLPGIAELHNAHIGMETTTIMLVGDPARAQAVVDAGSRKPMIGFTETTHRFHDTVQKQLPKAAKALQLVRSKDTVQ